LAVVVGQGRRFVALPLKLVLNRESSVGTELRAKFHDDLTTLVPERYRATPLWRGSKS
jgi:hypothetical protein